jgi:hypothetical protein
MNTAKLMRAASRQALVFKQNSPTLMFGVGVVGVLAGTVLAARATLKVEDVLVEAKDKLDTAKELHEKQLVEYPDRDYQQDLGVIYARTAVKLTKVYGPAILATGFGIVCLTGSHNILMKRNAALMASYAALERTYKAYRSRIREEVGEERERELHYESQRKLSKDEFDKFMSQKKNPYDSSIYARFFDESSRNWETNPEHNMIFLKCQQTYANDLLHSRGHIFLNEVYDMIGVPRSKAGQIVGWVIGDGDNFVDFGIFTGRSDAARDFVNNRERSILLDFNVDGVIYDKIER